MSSSIGDMFQGLLQRVDGLESVVITDRDGFVVVKCIKEGAEYGDMASEVSLWQASDQASKVVAFGKNMSLTCIYDRRGVNVGLLHALLPEIRQKLESVRSIVGNA